MLRILFTRLRAEEKLLKEAAERRGIPVELTCVSDMTFSAVPHWHRDDVILARCVSHGQNEAVAEILESMGHRVVNTSHVMRLCGNKLSTTLALQRASVPQPDFRVAISQDGALTAAAEMGFPVVFKPLSGSWGRLLAKVNDMEACEAVVEHKAMLGAAHSTYYIQEYVQKGGSDIRAFVVGGVPICAISRFSEHWITNTARGGQAEAIGVDEPMRAILEAVHGAIGGDFLAVDLFRRDGQWLVNEVNDGGEFRNSIAPTGVDIPGEVVSHVWSLREVFP